MENNINNKIDKSQKVLEVKNLRQYFKVGSGKNKLVVKAVNDISFDIYKREVFGLVGESGCGKTTTGRAIIKLYNPTDGTVKFNGKIVGVGHSGNLHQIKLIKESARYQIIETDPLKLKKYQRKLEYTRDIKVLNEEISQFKSLEKESITQLYLPNKLAIEEQNEIIRLSKIAVSEQKQTYKNEANVIKRSEASEILDSEKVYLNSAKKRRASKLLFLKEMKYDLEEHQEKLANIENDYTKQVAVVENETSEMLAQVDKLAEAKYKLVLAKRHKKDVNTIAELKSKVYELNANKEPNNNKELLENLKAKHDEEINQLNLKISAAMEVRSKLLVEKKDLLPNKLSIKNETVAKINNVKIKKAETKVKYVEDIQSYNLDAKNNPDKYVKDLTKSRDIRVDARKKIKEQRQIIRNKKLTDEFKETPEEKNARLTKIDELKNAQDLEIQNLKAKVNDEKELKVKVDEVVNKYQEQINEINEQMPDYHKQLSQMQMIFQDPISSLNPRMIVRDIIAESLIIRGVKDKEEIASKVYDVLELVGLTKDHALRYPHEFSGGQRQRIGIARALISNPNFIIADEPISALDVSIQAQVINLLNDLKDKLGLTILFIAHDLSVVKFFSDRIAVMYMGKIVELADSVELFENPLHPYTKSLLSAIPQPDPEQERTRKRVTYNPAIHDYVNDEPLMHEIKKGHFIYANSKELENYRKELK